ALELVDGVAHLLIRGIFILYLVSNTDTAGQVQAQLDISGSSCACRAKACDTGIGEKYDQYGCQYQAQYAFFLVHDLYPLFFIITSYASSDASARAAFIMMAHSTLLRCI